MSSSRRVRAALSAVLMAGLCLASASAQVSGTAAQAADLRVGEGWLRAQPPSGFGALKPRSAPYRSGVMAGRAVTTNQWFSSLVYEQWSDVLHAHPLSFRATPAGLELSLPVRRLVPALISRPPWAANAASMSSTQPSDCSVCSLRA